MRGMPRIVFMWLEKIAKTIKLLGNTTWGVLNVGANVTASVGSSIGRLAGSSGGAADGRVRQREMGGTIGVGAAAAASGGVAARIRHAGADLGTGLVSGVSGIVLDPWHGARQGVQAMVHGFNEHTFGSTTCLCGNTWTNKGWTSTALSL